MREELQDLEQIAGMLAVLAPAIALAAIERGLLDQLVADAGNRRCRSGTLSFYLIKLARLGGYLARSSDPPPGNTVIWRGLSRLTDIEIGLELGLAGNVGNRKGSRAPTNLHPLR
jgi:hypothetical protein